jgi:hypothetical protein
MTKREPLRLKLYRTRTIDQLESMLSDIKADPESKEGANPMYLYNRRAMKLMDEITWAMYYHRRRESASSGAM